MSGLQNFLAPFSHLLFANRNLDIVVLCFVLFAVAVYALQNYWRAASLERELANRGASAAPAAAGRHYASAPMVEESAQEPGGLPPIKGGRSYARNLGTALQKAGISSPQIYSPPTPTGFTPNANPMQPAIGQPGGGQPYGGPATPWATPAPPAPAPWGFPAGAGRNVPGPGPAPAPFYQPQPGGPAQPPPNMPPHSAPAFGPPAGYPQAQPPVPSQPNGPFASPFPVPTSGPAAPPPPAFAPPGMSPMAPPPGAPGPMMPGLPLPGMGQPGPEAEPADASRRGKPKRRRFNFNVLENLEKMVQSRPAEPATTTGWTPPAQAAPPAAPVANPSPAGTVPAGTPVPPVAQPESTLGKDEAAPTLPFLFEARSEPAKGSEPQAAEQTTAAAPVEEAPAAAAETPAWGEPDTASADEESIPSTDESAETVPVPAESPNVAEAEPDPESKPSMRSMMFGEEIGASIDAGDGEPVSQNEPPSAEVSERATEEPAPAPEAVAEPPAENESSWPSYPWTRRGEATASEDAAETPASDEQAEAVAEAASDEVDSEPAIATPTEASVAESDGAPAEATAEETGSDQPSTPSAAADGDKPSAGTLVIIEDDQTAASYYATLFKGNGYQVEVANDGVSGVDLCARVQPQVILLDVMMPRQNGILVLQTLRASDETKNTPVVVMSNFSEPTLIKRALQLGALEYVIKTQVEGPALLNALPRWMNREKAFAAA